MQCPALCCPLETIFLVISKFECWWETFMLLQKTVEPWIPERSWVLIDRVLFEWGYTSCSQVFSCKQFGDFFLDRWKMFVPHPLTKSPDSCQALLNFIEWWLMMSHLNEVIQVAARSLAASTSVTFISTDERCSFFIPWEKIPTAVKHFWISLSDDWSCFVWMRLYKLQSGLQLQAIQWLSSWQMRDVRSSSLHRKSWQLSSTFEFYCWWLVMFHLNEVI